MVKEKVKTGVAGLDDMLEGGLIPGRAYIVSGASGTGKTTLATQFLIEGAKNGERVLYVALDEPPNEVKANMLSYGWDLSRVQVVDATPDIMSYDKTPVRDVSTERKVVYFKEVGPDIRLTSERSPVDMSINTIQELIRQEMRVRRYTRVVVDSLSSLKYFYIKTSEENASLISFFRLLSDLGVTSLLTVQLAEVSKPDVEAHMSRGEIMLHKWFNGRGMMRGVTVEKFRGSYHDQRLRNMRITDQGMEIKLSAQEKAELGSTPSTSDEEEGEADPDASSAPATASAPAPTAAPTVTENPTPIPVPGPAATPQLPPASPKDGGEGI